MHTPHDSETATLQRLPAPMTLAADQLEAVAGATAAAPGLVHIILGLILRPQSSFE